MYVNLSTCRTNPLSPGDMEDAWDIDTESRYRYRFPRVSHTPLRLPGSERAGEEER